MSLARCACRGKAYSEGFEDPPEHVPTFTPTVGRVLSRFMNHAKNRRASGIRALFAHTGFTSQNSLRSRHGHRRRSQPHRRRSRKLPDCLDYPIRRRCAENSTSPSGQGENFDLLYKLLLINLPIPNGFFKSTNNP